MTIEIPLTQGKVAIIDDGYFELVSGYKWHAKKDCSTFYAATNIRGDDGKRKSLYMHRLILGLTGGRIDHIDGDGLNNTMNNLRSCTHAENMRNRKKHSNNASGYKGVSWHKLSRKWRAVIMVNRNEKHLGYFNCPKEAHQAYCKASREMHGEFSRLE